MWGKSHMLTLAFTNVLSSIV